MLKNSLALCFFSRSYMVSLLKFVKFGSSLGTLMQCRIMQFIHVVSPHLQKSELIVISSEWRNRKTRANLQLALFMADASSLSHLHMTQKRPHYWIVPVYPKVVQIEAWLKFRIDPEATEGFVPCEITKHLGSMTLYIL